MHVSLLREGLESLTIYSTEVKIESRHVEGKDLPKIEPVTDQTVAQLTAQQQPPIVEKTKAN